VIRLAAIAAFADDIFVTGADAHERIALLGAQIIAVTALAVLQLDGIAIEAGSTEVTSSSKSVIQAAQTFTSSRVTGTLILGINISGALAWLANLSQILRLSVESIGTGLATGSRVSWLALTMDLVTALGDFATGGKIVRVKGKWAGADHTISRRTIRGVSIVPRHTLLTVLTLSSMLAVGTDAGGTVAGIRVAIALAGNAVTAIWSAGISVVARSTILAGVSGVTGRAGATLHRKELVLASAICILIGYG